MSLSQTQPSVTVQLWLLLRREGQKERQRQPGTPTPASYHHGRGPSRGFAVKHTVLIGSSRKSIPNCIDLNRQWNHLLFFVFSSLEGHTPVNLLFCCSGCSISLLLLKGPQISQFLTSQGKGIAPKRIIMMMITMNNNNNNNNERNFV